MKNEDLRGEGDFSSLITRMKSDGSTYLTYTEVLCLFVFLFVFYESIKRELKTKLIYECRCDERLKTVLKAARYSFFFFAFSSPPTCSPALQILVFLHTSLQLFRSDSKNDKDRRVCDRKAQRGPSKA